MKDALLDVLGFVLLNALIVDELVFQVVLLDVLVSVLVQHSPGTGLCPCRSTCL